MFKVVLPFFDLQDNNREYRPGDTFPRDGMKVSAARFEELASNNNRRGLPVIEEIKEREETRFTRKRVKKDVD